jgi:hypothetical protein
MRVMFWLSRAYAPLWWDSNYASNDPLLRHPLPAVFTCQSLEYRERTKHTVGAFELSTSRTTDGFYGGSVGVAILSQKM